MIKDTYKSKKHLVIMNKKISLLASSLIVLAVCFVSCGNSNKSSNAEQIKVQEEQRLLAKQQQIEQQKFEAEQRRLSENRQRFDVEKAKTWLYDRYAYKEEIVEEEVSPQTSEDLADYLMNGPQTRTYIRHNFGHKNLKIELVEYMSDFVDNTWFHIEGIDFRENYVSFYINLKKLGNDYAIKQTSDDL